MKRIEKEDARLFLGGLQLGLHVIGALWRYAANRDAFLVVITCACREKTFNLLETPLSPGTSRHVKHGSHSNLKTLDVRDDETPWAKPRLRLAGWVRFICGVSSWGKSTGLTETLTPWVAEFIWLLQWRRAIVERRVLEDENGFESSWGFAAEPSASNFEQLKTLFYFGIRKAWFRIPPTITSVVTVEGCASPVSTASPSLPKLRGESGRGEGGSAGQIFFASSPPPSPREPTTPPCWPVGGVAATGDGTGGLSLSHQRSGKAEGGEWEGWQVGPILQGCRSLFMFTTRE
jgi:hypothetical protein